MCSWAQVVRREGSKNAHAMNMWSFLAEMVISGRAQAGDAKEARAAIVRLPAEVSC